MAVSDTRYQGVFCYTTAGQHTCNTANSNKTQPISIRPFVRRICYIMKNEERKYNKTVARVVLARLFLIHFSFVLLYRPPCVAYMACVPHVSLSAWPRTLSRFYFALGANAFLVFTCNNNNTNWLGTLVFICRLQLLCFWIFTSGVTSLFYFNCRGPKAISISRKWLQRRKF